MSFICDCDQVCVFSLIVYMFCFSMSTVFRVHAWTVRFMYLTHLVEYTAGYSAGSWLFEFSPKTNARPYIQQVVGYSI